MAEAHPQEKVEIETVESNKVYCANCKHCKLVRERSGNPGEYCLRVRCDAGKWRKRLGGEKVYKYFTVTRRQQEYCDAYEPMGEASSFMKDLRKTLPIKDETYSMEME